jgi:hypothetical protein
MVTLFLYRYVDCNNARLLGIVTVRLDPAFVPEIDVETRRSWLEEAKKDDIGE